MLRTLRSSPALLVAVIALVAATAGTATAATKVLIKSSAQVKNGSLEAADLSVKARKSLQGKAGPVGATGAPGAAGAAGPAGARGPSEAFVARPATANVSNCPAGGCEPGATIRTLALPAGSYLLTASMELAPVTFVADVSRSLECHLSRADTDEFQRVLHLYKAASASGGLTHDQALSITWAVTLPAPTSVGLSCYFGGVKYTASNARITALQVGSITEAVS